MNLAQILINMNSYPHNVRERTMSKFIEIRMQCFIFHYKKLATLVTNARSGCVPTM